MLTKLAAVPCIVQLAQSRALFTAVWLHDRPLMIFGIFLVRPRL
jgi:hypothetical protein